MGVIIAFDCRSKSERKCFAIVLEKQRPTVRPFQPSPPSLYVLMHLCARFVHVCFRIPEAGIFRHKFAYIVNFEHFDWICMLIFVFRVKMLAAAYVVFIFGHHSSFFASYSAGISSSLALLSPDHLVPA